MTFFLNQHLAISLWLIIVLTKMRGTFRFEYTNRKIHRLIVLEVEKIHAY